MLNLKREHVRFVKMVFGVAQAALVFIAAITTVLANPEMTQTQLLIAFWPLWLGVIGSGLLVWKLCA